MITNTMKYHTQNTTLMIIDPCKKCGDPYDFTCYLKDMDLLPIISGVIVIIGSFAAYTP